MPSLDDLIAYLSGVRINERSRERPNTVAGHLVESALRERWHELSEARGEALIRQSTNRLWDSYMRRRKLLGQSPKEAAEETIWEEIEHLRQELAPESSPPTLT